MSQIISPRAGRSFFNFFWRLTVSLVALLVMSSCFWRKTSTEEVKSAVPQIVILPAKTIAPKDQELQRLARYLEQADAVHREAWWVVAADRKSVGRSVFGKAQRALVTELHLKLANKSLFSCDRYLVKRDIGSALGLPQKGEIFEKCDARKEASRIAEFNLAKKTEADIYFYPQNLVEVVGIATSIMNRKVHCHFLGDADGKLQRLTCENMAQDRSPSQSIQFSVYDYQKEGQDLIKLKGQVFENLSPVRKIEAQVPMSGKITVTEIQTEAPEVEPAVAPVPAVAATPPPDGIPTAVERHRNPVAPAAGLSPAVVGTINPAARNMQPRGRAQSPAQANAEGPPLAVDENGNATLPAESTAPIISDPYGYDRSRPQLEVPAASGPIVAPATETAPAKNSQGPAYQQQDFGAPSGDSSVQGPSGVGAPEDLALPPADHPEDEQAPRAPPEILPSAR